MSIKKTLLNILPHLDYLDIRQFKEISSLSTHSKDIYFTKL